MLRYVLPTSLLISSRISIDLGRAKLPKPALTLPLLFVRDDSQGKAERDSAYVPLIAALNEHYKDVPLEEK